MQEWKIVYALRKSFSKYLTLTALFTVLCFNNIFADATPFKDNSLIRVNYQTSKELHFDSTGVIYLNPLTNKLDTFFDCEGGECVYTPDKYNVKLMRGIPDSFRLIFYFKEKTLVSPAIHGKSVNKYHEFLITDSEFKEITPIFKTSYYNYFSALFITIVLELMVGALFFWKYKIKLKNVAFIILINLMTHPVLWIVSANFTGFVQGNLIGEPLVVISEALLLYIFIRPHLRIRTAFRMSLIMNIVSFVLGGLIYLFLVY